MAETKKKPTTPKSRKTTKKEGRAKRSERLKTDPEFKKAYFEGKSKRANDKKASFRKKKKGKK
jgi:hypothetical protein